MGARSRARCTEILGRRILDKKAKGQISNGSAKEQISASKQNVPKWVVNRE
jgi:hypothetical protein